MIYIFTDLVLVWIILLLGRELYREGASPFYTVVSETIKIIGSVFKPVIRLLVPAIASGGKGLLKMAMKLFRK